MELKSLRLHCFRNYDALEAAFDPGVNLIVGDNAQGKTNLLEAIVYLSTGKAFRTRREKELIQFGKDFAELEQTVFSQNREQIIRAVLFAGRQRRQLYKNGVKLRTASQLHGILPTVLFCPEDLLVLKTGAAARRRLIDDALCQLRPNFATALDEYGRLLEDKSRILKDRWENPQLLQALPEFDERLAQVGAVVIGYRARYLGELARAAARFHDAFSGGKEQLTISYQTVSTVQDPLAGREMVYSWLKEHQESHRRAELETGQCLSGPHKDDFDAAIGGVSVKSFGSQGQTRTAAISLKLAERALFYADTGEEPVLLLDDVLSELDPGRQDFVLNQIRTGQVFITCCETEKGTAIGKTLVIQDGTIRE